MPARDHGPHEPNAPTPLLVRPKDAADMLAISERKLWQLTSCGTIPRVKVGKKLVRYKIEDLLRFIEARCEGRALGERRPGATCALRESTTSVTTGTRRPARRGRVNGSANRVEYQGEAATTPCALHGTVPDVGRESPAPEDGPLGA